MTRSEFLRLSGLGGLALATRAVGFPSDYQGIPQGIRPYLHGVRPDAMWVSWFSPSASPGRVEWGITAEALTQGQDTTLDTVAPGYHYQIAQLTRLSPATYYYYRVRHGSTTSDVFRFRTPPLPGTKSGRVRVLVMGDNQIIGENRYERLIACAKAKIESLFGVPIEEAVDFILMPGDQVDVGTWEQYRDLHFKQCGLVSPYLPIMTTVGNHETYQDTGLARYRRLFRYDDVRYAGVSGRDGDAYYAYQLANIAFIHSSSEHPGPEQRDWLRSVVDALKQDSTTDLCVSAVHRPYQAEQYVGDISGWFRSEIMPMLAETEKHVLNIGAHHHLYARGQTREWPIYHLISGGTAWDQFWGQSTETNFDDVQKTIANWAWQLLEFDLANRRLEVRCFAEANVKLPESTRWNYHSRLIDSFHRYLGLASPERPSLTSRFSAPVTPPLELVSSPFTTTTQEQLNSTWFQVAADAAFADLRIDRIRDFESLFGDTGAPRYEPVDVHAGLDLLRFPITSGLVDGRYFARVRHRDSNAQWSPWSEALAFEITGSTFREPRISLEKSVFAPGEDLSIRYEQGPGLATDWIGIYRKGQTPGPTPSTTWGYVTGSTGTLALSTDLDVGEWFAAFFTNDGYTEVAPRVPFYVGRRVSLTLATTNLPEGSPVRIQFEDAPGAETDWIGIYRPDDVPGTQGSVQWKYANTTNGSREFNGLAKGHYWAAFFINDGYQEISHRLPFTVGKVVSSVSMTSSRIAAGEGFAVQFSQARGVVQDRLAVFRQGQSPTTQEPVIARDISGKGSGEVLVPAGSLPPGNYFVVLIATNPTRELSNRWEFTVTPGEALLIDEVRLEDGQLHLRWEAAPGQAYFVERTVDFLTWSPALTLTATSNPQAVTFPTSQSREFFRVRPA
ncbi:MAG: fibronectin type III domain-containing protein [Verrucomicrobia bacterium]|nr:fibronectin type III domain-containing protein [Verrucomicrobiota bacterium]